MEVESLRRVERPCARGKDLIVDFLEDARLCNMVDRPEGEVFVGCSEVVWGRAVALKKIEIWSFEECFLNRNSATRLMLGRFEKAGLLIQHPPRQRVPQDPRTLKLCTILIVLNKPVYEAFL